MSAKEKEGWIWTFWSQVRDKRKKRMRAAENLSLGGKRSLVLVECDGNSFLVGCGADAVNCILPLPAMQTGFPLLRTSQNQEQTRVQEGLPQ